MKQTLHNFPIHFEDIKPHWGYNTKAPTRVIPSRGSKVLDKVNKVSYTARVKKGITRMKTFKKSTLGKAFDLTVVSVVILLNELAAFLYIRDNIGDQNVAYGIAGFAVFCSTYIVFKFIARK